MPYTPMAELDRLIAETGGFGDEDDFDPGEEEPIFPDARSRKDRILELSATGLKWDEIAARAGFSPSTVRVTLARLGLVDSRLTKKRRKASLSRHNCRGGHNGGRPRQKNRCVCGEMTKKRAKARYHRCDMLHSVRNNTSERAQE